MELGEAVMWILGALVVAGMLLVLYMSMDIKRITEESDAPYKLEPAEQLAVSEQPKKRGRPVGSKNKQPTRGYTKRSSYWTDKRKRAAAKKARQEKIKTARTKAREAVGH